MVLCTLSRVCLSVMCIGHGCLLLVCVHLGTWVSAWVWSCMVEAMLILILILILMT